MKSRRSITPLLLAGTLLLAPVAQASVVVRLDTVMGNIDLWLRDDLAWDTVDQSGNPITVDPVDNFLSYVISGTYSNTFVYRSEPGFVIQAGDYAWVDSLQDFQYITTEADPLKYQYILPNTRGTIAMARTDDPNSARMTWFINLADNTDALGEQSVLLLGIPVIVRYGYTVFGSVLGDGMDVVDAIAALPTEPGVGPTGFPLPVRNYTSGQPVTKDNLVLINSATVLASAPGDATPILATNGSYSFLTFMSDVTSSDVAAAGNPSPGDAPSGVSFDDGFYSFTLSGVSDTSSVALTLPSGQTPNTYYKYGPTPDNHTPHWYNFKYDGHTGAVFYPDTYAPNVVGLVFIDGERGDDDLTANGVIADVGGPGVGPTSGGGGGGGTTDILTLLASLWATSRRSRRR